MAALGKSTDEGAADALKRQLAELGGAEALLQAILDSASDCILVLSPDGTILLSGRALPRASSTSLLRTSVYEHISPETREAARSCVERVVRSGASDWCECAIACKHGQVALCEARISPILRGGRIATLLMICTDVTERRATEAALRRSEERYRSVIAALDEGIVLQDAGGTIEACNASAERILGLTSAEMAGRESRDPRWRAVHEDGAPFNGESHPAIVTLRTGAPQKNVIMGVHRPEGEMAWISINSQPLLRAGEVIPYAVVTSFHDITERKRSVEELRRSEERYRATFDQAAVGIGQVSVEGRWLRLNQKFCDLVGYSPAEMTDLTFQQITYPPDLPADLENLRRILSGEVQTASREKRYVRKGGELIWAKVTVSLVRHDSGGPAYFIVIAEDITDRKHVEETRHEFLTIASHELKTPLTPVMLRVQALLRTYRRAEGQPPAAEEVIPKLEAVEALLDRLRRLVEELLDISQITAGPMTIAPKEIDLSALLRDILGGRQAELLRRAACPLTVDAPSALSGCWDPLRIEQIIMNLLSNASKYGGGKPIDVALEASGDMARLTVRDRGIGIAAADHERIFGCFQRATTSRHYSGFGLGLWIVREAAEAMGGAVRVESRLGEGARFTVELPRAPRRAGR
ncbi:PAS domain S-box protein [Sorangium sp. So ce375]|uniref:PAS domain-containing sensor histidine kinase n=1 Tax=Sorangium sp. So ce375 TaxID=3133306 RepID=UPI003F5B6DF9